MEDFSIRVATDLDVPAIVTLANQNTYQVLSAADRQAGFLTGLFTEEAILQMMHSAPCVVANAQQELAGFLINSKLTPAAYPPLVQHISHIMPGLTYRNLPLITYNWFFYGPVLVTKKFRGKGLLSRLFHKSKEQLQGNFEVGIAFIDAHNIASYTAHTKRLGLETIGQFTFQAHVYHIMAFSVINAPV